MPKVKQGKQGKQVKQVKQVKRGVANYKDLEYDLLHSTILSPKEREEALKWLIKNKEKLESGLRSSDVLSHKDLLSRASRDRKAGKIIKLGITGT